jgi:hypothetical protein
MMLAIDIMLQIWKKREREREREKEKKPTIG